MTSFVSSNPRQPAIESSPSSARHRLFLLALVAAAFLLVPAAQAAAADFSLEVSITGTGEGGLGCKVNAGPLEECEEEYEEGTQVAVFAEPEPGSEFVEWNGECDTVAGDECKVEIDADKTIEVVFDLEEFELSIEAEGTGEGVVECQVESEPYEPCPASETYPYGTAVILYAEPEEGSEFVEWGGDCSGVEVECELTVEEPLSVTATFKPEPPFELTIETGGTGAGEVECEVEAEPAEACDPEAEYEEGTEITVIAEPKAGSEFSGWSGECDNVVSNKCEVEMDADKTVKATFNLKPTPKFALKVKKTGTGTGKVESTSPVSPKIVCGAECEKEFVEGTKVTLAQSADPGSEFVEWSGACTGTGACEVTMSAAKEVTAKFDLKPVVDFALKVKKIGTGTGKVTSTPAGIDCGATCEAKFEEGEEVELSQSPASGSEFSGWGGACTGTGSCEVTMTEAKEVTATFKPIPRTLAVTEAGTGEGAVKCKFNGTGSPGACTSPQPNGTTVELLAFAEAGSEFAGFSSGTGSASACATSPCSFTLQANSSITATFDLGPTPEFELEINLDGTGEGEVECKVGAGPQEPCEAEYAEGTEVTLVPIAETGSEFVKWAGDCTGSGACKVTMSANKSVTATFDEEEPPTPEFKLAITKAGTGSGTVTCDGGACAAKYPEGEEVTLAATAASGSTFSGFSGAGCSGTAPCVVTIEEEDVTVTATFTAKEEAKKEEPKKEEPKPPTEGSAKAAGSATVKSGKASLKLSCTGGPCKGTIQLKAKVKQGKKTKTLVIGKASFSIAEGASATVKVKLSGPAKQELAKGKVLKAKASGAGVTASTVKLKLAKK